ncbi:MAG: nucleotidyltransferase domain-containing protein [Lachnospiraceae bacterium]|nr:nucleotidyltransferase domain-containing protein [Lachnospiraceae bacterium]
MAEFATENEIHIWLCGSFQKGTASPYSDVDIRFSAAYPLDKEYEGLLREMLG